MKLTLRERLVLLLCALLHAAALLLLRARLRLDLSREGGRTARPGRRDSMTAAEVRAFAARHGIRYPSLPDREQPGELPPVVRPLAPGGDVSPADLEAMACPVVADARRAFAEAREGAEPAPPADPHAVAPGDFVLEDAELAAA